MSSSTLTARLLCVLLAIEIFVAAYLVVRRFRLPLPPDPALAQLHPATQAELRTLREQVIASDEAPAWRDLGEAFLLFGLLVDAEYCFRQAAELEPDVDRTMYLWGLALHQQGQMAAAIERFERAARLTGSTPGSRLDVSNCWYAIGRNLLRQEDADAAERAFKNAGEFPPAMHQRIRILVRADRLQEAIALLDPLIARYPLAAKLYQLRAAAREGSGDLAGAFADLQQAERAIEFLPSDFIVQELHQDLSRFGVPRELAECQEQLASGQLEVAAQRLQTLLDERWQTQIALMLAECEIRRKRGLVAVELVQRVISSEGVSARLLNMQARGLMAVGSEAEAVAIWERSASIQPNAEAHVKLAAYYAKAGDAASEKYHRVQRRLAHGVAAYRQDELVDAVSHLQAALELDAQLDQGWYYLAMCYLARGTRENAKEALSNCLQANPNHGRARRVLSTIPGAP